MNKFLSTAVMLSLGMLLTGCSVHHKSTSIVTITDEKLADGTVTRVGYKEPQTDWGCTELARLTNSRVISDLKGQFKLGGEYEVLKEDAIKYANEKRLKPNYIFLYVPGSMEFAGIDTATFSKNSATYLQCKKLPALRTSLF